MGDLNGTDERVAIAQHKLKMQAFTHGERAIDPQSEPLFRHIHDVAGKRLGASPDLTGSINGNAIELSVIGHALHVFFQPLEDL